MGIVVEVRGGGAEVEGTRRVTTASGTGIRWGCPLPSRQRGSPDWWVF